MLNLGPYPIPCVDQVRFLGVIFDKRLDWIAHVNELRKRCFNRLNILRVLSNTSWGADRISLMKVYQGLIHSKIDYGCIVYSSALALVDNAYFSGLQSVNGTFCTTPVLKSVLRGPAPPPPMLRRHRLAEKQFQNRLLNSHDALVGDAM